MYRASSRWHQLLGAYLPTATHAASAGAATTRPSSMTEVTANYRKTEAAAAKLEADRALGTHTGFYNLPHMYRLIASTAAAGSDGINPVMSSRQLRFIRDVYHADAVATLNHHTLGSQFEGHPLDVVIRATAFDAVHSVIHTAACEHFNLSFALRSLRPYGTPVPHSLEDVINTQFGGLLVPTTVEGKARNSCLRSLLLYEAINHQARSGWLYLVAHDSHISVRVYQHGTCPLSGPLTPLLCINLHDYAYSLDYKPSAASQQQQQQQQQHESSASTSSSSLFENYVRNAIKAWNWNVASRNYDLATGRTFVDLLKESSLS